MVTDSNTVTLFFLYPLLEPNLPSRGVWGMDVGERWG